MKPFLNTGMTLAILSLSGKIPVSKDSLIKVEWLTEMRESEIFSNFIGILFGPQDLPFFRDWITDDTSSEVQGVMKNESKSN